MTTTYRISHAKGRSTVIGTLTDALAAAIEVEREHQPAFGVDVQLVDDIVAHVRHGAAYLGDAYPPAEYTGDDADALQIVIDASRYEDEDDGLAAAAAEVADLTDCTGWDLSARWDTDQRDGIRLSLPTWADLTRLVRALGED